MNAFGLNQFQQQHPFQDTNNTNQTNKTKIPPASSKAINSLTNTLITSDDLQEESNRECAICLEEQKAGDYAVKLACGHLYHMSCLRVWLNKQCTCPTCRFELETDDVEYESERKKRMKLRKPRYRLDELMSSKYTLDCISTYIVCIMLFYLYTYVIVVERVAELKELSQSFGINITGKLFLHLYIATHTAFIY